MNNFVLPVLVIFNATIYTYIALEVIKAYTG